MAVRMEHISNNSTQRAICFLENTPHMSLLRNSSTQEDFITRFTCFANQRQIYITNYGGLWFVAELWRHKILLQLNHVYDRNNLDSGMASSISMIQGPTSIHTDNEINPHEYIRKEANECMRQIWIPKCPI